MSDAHICATNKGGGLTTKELVPHRLRGLPRGRHDLRRDLQLGPEGHLLPDLDHPVDIRVVQEALHVEDQDWGHGLDEHLLARVQRDARPRGGGHLYGGGCGYALQRVLDGVYLFTLVRQ